MEAIGELLARYDVLGAFWLTILLTLGGTLGALLIGLVLAVMRVSPIRVFQGFAAACTEILINTPLTLVVFFCWFGIHQLLRVDLSPPGARQYEHAFWWGVIALAVYHSAFIAENIRSGVNTVPQGQAEAARAIGLGFGAGLREVVLPQAVRGAIAPVGNTIIALTKNTTVVATIGVAEASYLMKGMIEFSPDLLIFTFVIMATGFVVITLPMGILFTTMSRRLAVRR